jgi:hypothetical protein
MTDDEIPFVAVSRRPAGPATVLVVRDYLAAALQQGLDTGRIYREATWEPNPYRPAPPPFELTGVALQSRGPTWTLTSPSTEEQPLTF